MPVAPTTRRRRALEALYRDGHHVQPVLEAILQHPAVYTGPRMVKPPVVHVAGLLRRIGAGITTTDWSWIGSALRPAALLPAERRRLGRRALARHRDVPRPLDRRAADPAGPQARSRQGHRQRSIAQTVLRAALAFWHNPALTDATHAALLALRARALADAGKQQWKQVQYPVLLENALRQLIAVSPDLQTS